MTIAVEQLKKSINAVGGLPTLPGIVQKISRITADVKSSAQDLSNVISKDQVLSSRILRLVNSPIYGFPGRISSIKHAIVLLGFNVVKGLMLGTAVFDFAGGVGRGLWEHSLGCGILSRRIAKELRMPEFEEVMISGLLHDLGKVVLANVAPVEYRAVVQRARERRLHIAQAEREIIGADHTEVAGWVAEHWNFPSQLAEPLTFHHRPSSANGAKEATAAVHLADILARGLSYGSPGDMVMSPIDHSAFYSLRLSFAQIDKIIEDAEIEYASGVDVFDLGD
ncbi:MAG: HDOD domain-containing protein [Candidatus Hydrogenedentes bacterium]|nr:HDOD domain-containing protein [Candidatus Hydrogenedentota bacterium]